MTQLTEHDAGGLVLNNITVADHTVLRRLVLLGTPLALAILEIFHPERPSSASEAVEQGVWFMWFHFIQVPLIGLIALAVYLLTDGLEGRAGSRAIRARAKLSAARYSSFPAR